MTRVPWCAGAHRAPEQLAITLTHSSVQRDSAVDVQCQCAVGGKPFADSRSIRVARKHHCGRRTRGAAEGHVGPLDYIQSGDLKPQGGATPQPLPGTGGLSALGLVGGAAAPRQRIVGLARRKGLARDHVIGAADLVLESGRRCPLAVLPLDLLFGFEPVVLRAAFAEAPPLRVVIGRYRDALVSLCFLAGDRALLARRLGVGIHRPIERPSPFTWWLHGRLLSELKRSW